MLRCSKVSKVSHAFTLTYLGYMFDDEYEHVCLDDLFMMQSHVYLDLAMFVFLPCILAAMICLLSWM